MGKSISCPRCSSTYLQWRVVRHGRPEPKVPQKVVRHCHLCAHEWTDALQATAGGREGGSIAAAREADWTWSSLIGRLLSLVKIGKGSTGRP